MDVQEEHAPVSLGHAVADPGAVVIIGHHTSLASAAVFGSEGLLELADCAVLHLDKNRSGVFFGFTLLFRIDVD